MAFLCYIRVVSDTLVNIHFVYNRHNRAQLHAALQPRPSEALRGRVAPASIKVPIQQRYAVFTLRAHPTPRLPSSTAYGPEVFLPVTLRPRPRHVGKADFPIGYVSLSPPALALRLAASARSRPRRVPPGDASPHRPVRKRMRRAPSLAPVDSRPRLPSRHGGRR